MVSVAKTFRVSAGVVAVVLSAGCAHVPLRQNTQAQRASSYALYMRGLLMEKTLHLTDALDAYEQALEHDYDSPFLYVRIGATHVKLGQPEQALKSFQRALSLEPTQQDALRWLAILYTSQGQLQEAIRVYEQLIQQEPTDRFLLSTLADLYVLQGQLTKAAELYERLITEYGSSQPLHFNLGVLYGRMGQYAEAIQQLSRAAELAPQSVEIRVALGLTYELSGQLEKAAAHYEDAIQLDPLNPRLYRHAARVEANTDHLQEAIQHYQTALDLVPDDVEAVMGLVRLWILQKRFSDAQDLLGAKLHALGPSPELYLVLGLLYREAGAPEEALRAFAQAVWLNQASAQAHFYLAAQLERLNRKPEARQELRRVIALDPNHADALNYLGYLDAEDGVNLQEAKALIERALALDPANGAYLDSLGWVYYQLGNFEEALRHLERAAAALDTDATVFDHLGDAYLKQGRLDNAQQAWEKSLELDRTRQTVSRKLEQLMHREAAVSAPSTTP